MKIGEKMVIAGENNENIPTGPTKKNTVGKYIESDIYDKLNLDRYT